MKRMICLLLSLIMLVSLVSVTAVTASAASAKTSEAAITVLKKMATFKKDCYQVADTQEFRIGYGTVCAEKGHKVDKAGNIVAGEHEIHTINEAQADKLLRTALTELDKKVNAFATKNGLSLKQNQFDALVVFSFGSGTAWMDGNGLVKTAVVNKAGANELLNAMYSVNRNMARSKIEVNMYINNVYSNDVPDNFAFVAYDPNGGSMSQALEADENGKMVYKMYYDTASAISHPASPIKSGCKFIGWYFVDSEGNATGRAATLTSASANKTLKALWQTNGLAAKDADAKANTVKYSLSKSMLASTTIYDIPSTSGKNVGKAEGSYTATRDYVDADGSRWARIPAGWVLVTSANGSVSGDSAAVMVTVTNSYVNSRENATIKSNKNGSYKQGANLYILATKNADGFLWGQVAKSKDDTTPVGWVALMYTNYNSIKDSQNSSGSGSNTTTSKAVAKATVTYQGYVNLRSGAGTNNQIVGSLAKNETVDVYEIKVVSGHRWGRISTGWFCLTYANVTMLGGNSDVSVSDDALAYTFSGTLMKAMTAYDQADEQAAKAAYQPAADTAVNIHNFSVKADGSVWVKLGWTVKVDNKNVNKYGWVKLTGEDLSDKGTDIKLNPVKFTVIANEINVRSGANSGTSSIFKLNKGVEIEVHDICLTGEEIWGYVTDEYVVDGKDGSDNWSFDGYVNLSNKYVKRSTLPNIKPDAPSATGKVATVINVDKVNVRKSATTASDLLGKLARGTTAAVLEVSEDGKWYNLDIDVDKDPKTGSWVYKDYLSIQDASSGSNGSSNNGSSNEATITGTGVVANTYAGVNVRTGAGTAYAATGKLMPGTAVEILEVKTVGAAKWGRTEKGWVCMDYISMISQDVTYPTNPGTPEDSTTVGSYDDAETTTTTAVYTGTVTAPVNVYAAADHHNVDDTTYVTRTLNTGDPITIYELIAVTEIVDKEDEAGGGHGTDTQTTVTSYWARTNDGYIFNPESCINLNALDEKTHTLTGSQTLNVRSEGSMNGVELGKLKRGDQVAVTALNIEKDKVWGRIEFNGEEGWIRLDYMSEGAIYEAQQPNTPAEPPKQPELGNTGNTGNGGFVNNDSPYLYTGKVINTNEVNVRALPSTAASKTTVLKSGAKLVIYETTIAENMAWGKCDAGWVYLYYVDLTPTNGALDARVVYNDNTIIYSDSNCSETTGSTYARMSVVDVYEIVGKMARTDKGWVNTDDLLG